MTPRIKYLKLQEIRTRLTEIQLILESNLYEDSEYELTLLNERCYLKDKEDQLVNSDTE